jgi:hypothetical protein
MTPLSGHWSSGSNEGNVARFGHIPPLVERNYTAVPTHGGPARVGQSLRKRFKLLDWCAYLCSQRLLRYTLHVCVVCQSAGRTSKQLPQISCNCSRSRSLLFLATVSHNVQSDKFALTGNLVYLVSQLTVSRSAPAMTCYDFLPFPVTHS